MISEKTLSTLEFHKILDQVAVHASFSAGAALVRDLNPSTELEEARTWQRETAEMMELLDSRTGFTLAGARDVSQIAMNAERGVLVDAQGLLDIRQTMKRSSITRRSLGKLKGQYPLLSEIAEELEECKSLVDAIESTIDDNGEVRDSASTKLAIIRRDLKISFERLQSKLNRIIASQRNAPILQEAIITMRGGRYVIPIKAENKGKIPGIVHDSSSSGATLFIEPLETVELNNQWRELQIEEEKEIRRILAELTALVGAESERIVRSVQILAYLDMTMAKALYAQKTKAVMPQLAAFTKDKNHPQHPGSSIALRGVRHPLLHGNVVPVDVLFDEATWALVVTGPNTGGKTVALKAVGLMALMAQAGLHLPAEEARISVFDGIYADIGDEQSIEQSLSTFSAHMTNIIAILRDCDERSLVILDEMGAGTDPAEGAALARALLDTLIARRVTTMVSTHHPELKIYAVEKQGARNASMEFDLETLSPTYRLVVGLPGRSNALAIAQRLGLDLSIIEAARHMVALEDLAADDLLDEIQRTRASIRQQNSEIEALRDELQSQRDQLQARIDKIEDERRDVIRAARRNAEQELEGFKRELRKMQSEMKMAGMPLDKVRALQEAAQKMLEWTQSPMDEGEVERVSESEDWTPRLGDTVYLETLNAEGTIVELDDKGAMVQVGTLKVRARTSDMRKRTRSEKRATERGHKRIFTPSNVPPPIHPSPGLELDLRGHTVEEALNKLDHYIDAAYMAGLPFGRIIHGKGTGRLRQAVQEYLTGHALVNKLSPGEANEGGAGVTIIHLAQMA